MIHLKKISFFLILVSSFGCSIGKNKLDKPLNERAEIIDTAKIDSVSINEMKWYFEEELPSIFEYYNEEKTGEYSTWSPKLFGRCCSNTDLTFTENLFFKISSDFSAIEHPASNLSDTEYLSAYGFKTTSNVKISLSLDKDNSFLEGEYSNKNLLDSTEIIMNPIRLSIINGNVISEDLFYKNGRVKEIDFYINNEYKKTIVLMDTPVVQELMVDAIFRTNDIITLLPKSYYSKGDSSTVYITEIQTNLGAIAIPSLNEKFNLIELLNKDH